MGVMFRAASGDPLLLLKRRIYCHRNSRTCRKKRLHGGGAWGLGTLTSVFYSSKMSSQRKGRWEGEASPIPKYLYFFNVRGGSTNEIEKGEIGKMCLRRRLDVCALSETKLMGRGYVMFGEVVGRVFGMAGGRAREGWLFC